MRSFSARSGFPQSLEKKFLSVVCVQLSVDFAAVGILSGQKNRMQYGHLCRYFCAWQKGI